MSRYLPSPPDPHELDVVRSPYVGGEWMVHVSRVGAQHLGRIERGVLALNGGAAVTGNDVQINCATPLYSAGACSISVLGGPSDGTASFIPPAWVADQSFSFPRATATDVISDSQFTSLTGVVVSGGDRYSIFDLWSLPELSTYKPVGCITSADFNFKEQRPVGISCGRITDAWVRPGRTQPGNLSLASKFKGVLAGLARYNGMRATVMLVGIKNGVVMGDRIVFTGFVPGTAINAPDGEGEMMEQAEGKFEEVLTFAAPYTPDPELVGAGGGPPGVFNPETGEGIYNPETGEGILIPNT